MLSARARTVGLRRSLASAVLVLVGSAAIARAMSARPPPSARAATELERQQLDARVAALEAKWTTESVQAFPGDHWSQDDAFHNAEQDFVRSTAARLGVRPSGLLLAIDAGLHAPLASASGAAAPSTARRRAAVVPCKPRPFYD